MPRITRKAGLMALAFFALTFGGATSARADLVLLGTTDQLGSGIGGQLTILNFTVTGPPSNITEAAAIVRTANGDQIFAGANTQVTGGANNQTRTLAEAGITDGSQFRLILNINEPDDLVTLSSLRAVFYSSTGAVLHTAVLGSCGQFGALPCNLPEVGGGIGGQGIVFGLTAAEAGIISAQITALGAGNIFVGIGTEANLVTLTNAQGGFETFNIARGPGDQVIPEPTTMLLLGTGLAGIAAKVRRRRKASRAD